MSSSPRILLIDDHGSHAEIRALLLRQFGCETVVRTTPTEGLEELRAGIFELVIVDYHLDAEQNGDALARQIRGEIPGLPLIMLTGDAKIPDDARASVDAVLIKGASSPADLWATIQDFLPLDKKMRPRHSSAVFHIRSKTS